MATSTPTTDIVVTSDHDNTFCAYRPAAKQPESKVLECDARRPLLLEDNQPVTGWHGGQNNNGDNHSLLVVGEDLFVFRHAGSVDAADWNGDGRMDLVVSTENPSDQPLGEILHLLDRAFLDNELPVAELGTLDRK